MDVTLNKIEKQKKLSKHILSTLKENGFNAIIAGGAVRDWHYSIPATDLDIFIAGEPCAEAIIGMFGVGIRPLSTEDYSEVEFSGFECDMGGETVQFLFHDVEDPRELPPKFPVSICQCYWDGEEEWWFSEWFAIGERYRALIYTEEESFNLGYLCKIGSKFPGRRSYTSVGSFFESGFKPRRERLWTLDELEGLDVQAVVDF